MHDRNQQKTKCAAMTKTLSLMKKTMGEWEKINTDPYLTQVARNNASAMMYSQMMNLIDVAGQDVGYMCSDLSDHWMDKISEAGC